MRIDSHQHFWLMERRQGQWPPPDLAAICHDFLPGDIKAHLNRAGVQGTVVVQSLPDVDDTLFLLDLAGRNDFILGVVGWVDMKDQRAPEMIATLAVHPKFKGLRPMLQGIPDPDWIDDPILAPAVAAMVDHDLAFDGLILPHQMAPLTRFAARYPDLRVVIDHGAKPLIAEGRFVDWRKRLTALAELPNVSCKLSGLLVEAGEQRPEAVRPYAETILELFGPERVIWGSDWPVVNLVSDYQSWLDQCLDIVPAHHHDAVFGGNAINFYRLKSGR
ncbi:MAG TPA: amidohydrolase family protein [Ensifer sp.]|nr:amidohydrolase family protein [Ensifer sp.]